MFDILPMYSILYKCLCYDQLLNYILNSYIVNVFVFWVCIWIRGGILRRIIYTVKLSVFVCNILVCMDMCHTIEIFSAILNARFSMYIFVRQVETANNQCLSFYVVPLDGNCQ